MALETAQQKVAPRDMTHVVSAHDDRGKIPDRTRHACLETKKIPVHRPAGTSPAEVSKNSHKRLPLMSGGLDPLFNLLDQGVARFLPGDEVQASLAPQSRDIDAGALQLILRPLIGLLMPQEDAHLSLPGPGSEEPDGGLELLLALPEVRHVIARCYCHVP